MLSYLCRYTLTIFANFNAVSIDVAKLRSNTKSDSC